MTDVLPIDTTPPPTATPPGWYPDPWSPGGQRWWSGAEWTVHATPPLGYRWAPTGAVPVEPEPSRWFPKMPALPMRAAVVAASLVVLVTAAGAFTEAIRGYKVAVALIALTTMAVSVIGFPLTAWLVSRRLGTGSMRRDLGFGFKPIDLALGVGGAFGLTVIVITGGLIIKLLGAPEGSNLSGVEENGRNIAVFAFLMLFAGVIAPFTEELLFRGVIMRGLSSRFGRIGATVGQAVVFGGAHLTVSQGWGNIGLIVILTCLGLGLGFLAQLTGRLGAGMVAHSLFNIGQLSLLWLTLGR